MQLEGLQTLCDTPPTRLSTAHADREPVFVWCRYRTSHRGGAGSELAPFLAALDASAAVRAAGQSRIVVDVAAEFHLLWRVARHRTEADHRARE